MEIKLANHRYPDIRQMEIKLANHRYPNIREAKFFTGDYFKKTSPQFSDLGPYFKGASAENWGDVFLLRILNGYFI